MELSYNENMNIINENICYAVLYILSHDRNNSDILYENGKILSRKAYNENICYKERVIALQCLFLLCPSNVIELLLDKPINEVHMYWQYCKYLYIYILNSIIYSYLSVLEENKLTYSYDEIASIDKEYLINGILRDHPNECELVNMVTQMLLDFNIKNISFYKYIILFLSIFVFFFNFFFVIYLTIWYNVFKKLVNLKQYRLIIKTMIELTKTDLIESYSPLCTLWNQILQKLIEEICKELENDINNKKYKEEAINLLNDIIIICESNPFLLKMNLISMIKTLVNVGDDFISIVVRLSLLIPSIKGRIDVLNQFVNKGYYIEVLFGLSNGVSEISLTENSIELNLIHKIYDEINKQKLFKIIKSTQFYSDFIDYLIFTNSIDYIIENLVCNGNIDNAISLLNNYNEKNENNEISMINTNNPTRVQPLKEFITKSQYLSNNLLSLLSS